MDQAAQERYNELRRRYQASRKTYLEARRGFEETKRIYVKKRDQFIALFKRAKPVHARKIEQTVAERGLPDPDEAFSVIAGVLAIRRGPTEV
jgi:hypothetical protein